METIKNSTNPTTNSVEVNRPIITEETTLRELLDILNLGEKPHETPTPKMLRETAGEPIATEERITVYGNGFAVYDNGSGRTVVWLPDCTSFTYVFVQPKESEVGIVPEKETLPEGFLEEQPWAISVTLIGDHRVDANLMNRTGSRTGSTDYNAADNGDRDGDAEDKVEASYREEYTWREGRFGENPLDAILREEERQEQLEAMTENQRRVFILYYQKGYNQEEIAAELNCALSTVNQHLKYAIKKIKKISRHTEKNILPTTVYERNI